jgi:hypothetical protein
MRRVLMVSPHFPPDTSAAAHRVRLLAPHLPAWGWEPTVLTVAESAYEGRLDPDLAALVPESLRVVRTAAIHAGLTRHLGIGDLGLRSTRGLLSASRRLLSREPFDALFITTYPTYPAAIGPMLKRRHRVAFVLDYQDPWVGAWGREVGGGPGGVPDFKSRLTRAIALRMEPFVVRAADAITAVSEGTYQDVLRRVSDATPRACAAIPIGFDAADLARLRAAPRLNHWFDRADGRVHVCYVGTLLPTGLEVLRAVFAGLARLRDTQPALFARLRIHFLGTSNQRDCGPGGTRPPLGERVRPIAEQMGVAAAIVEEPPRLDYLDALNVQAQAHAILLIGSMEPHYTASKVFPALLSGRPILAVYHARSSVVDILAGRRETDVLTFGPSDPSGLVPQIAASWASLVERADIPLAAGVMAGDDERIKPWSAPLLAGQLARVFDRVVETGAAGNGAQR